MKKILLYPFILLVFVGCIKNKKRSLNNRAAKIIYEPSLYKSKEKVDSAIMYLDKAIMIDSNYYTAWSNKQEAYEVKLLHVEDSLERRKNFKKIVQVYDKLIELRGHDPLLIVKQATWLKRLRLNDSANEKYRIALETINKRFSENKGREIDYFLKVCVLCEMGNLNKANKFYVNNKAKLKNSMNFLDAMVFNSSDSLNCEEVIDHAPS